MSWINYDWATERAASSKVPTHFARISSHLEQLGANSSKVHDTQLVSFTVDAPGIWPVDATSGAVVVDLPDATASADWSIVVIKIDASGNAVDVARAGSDTLEGGTSNIVLAAQRDRKKFDPIGIDWIFDL